MGGTCHLYLGAPGSGKSTLMRSHIESIAATPDAPLVLAIDHAGEWAPTIEALGGRSYTSIDAWYAEPRAVASFAGISPWDVARLAIDVGWSVLVDDEVDLSLGEGPWRESPLREILKRGRHLRNAAGVVTTVAAMIATHRPSNLPTDILGLFASIYVGRLQGLRDAERVQREGWIEAASVGDAVRRLGAMSPGTFVRWPR